MVKKRTPKVNALQEEKVLKPVRLGLSPADHKRLERCARARGLSNASYARMVVLERIRADESEGGGR